MKILYTAFNGIHNSSKILLDKINCDKTDKLYLKNSYTTSVEQLKNKLLKKNYDLIISFGQAPLANNTLKIEKKANNIESYETTYDYTNLKIKLNQNGFNTIISNNAGNYFCNNIYYHGLKYIYEKNISCKMLFIHIPKIENIDNITLLSKIFENWEK